jgi:hypothetical protein
VEEYERRARTRNGALTTEPSTEQCAVTAACPARPAPYTR